ncbi:MAG: hypothetical protein ACNS64_04235, partial [Candidatus Halalkalibacterium sp. M3_1C_030]
MLSIKKSRIENLKNSIAGKIILPEDSSYDQARTIWNDMIDKKPAMIVQVVKAEDVSHAVRFAKDHQLELSV